jgi:tetratricopeptide (TPR) repeat protein
MRVRAIVVALLALAGMAGAAREKPRPGEAKFRHAWQTYVQPLVAPEKFPTRAARDAAGAQAVEEMAAAVAAQRGNADYLVSLSYLQFQTFKWREAQETAKRASRAAPKAALPMVLLAGVKGAIAAAQTEDVKKALDESLSAYRQAAERDPNNAAILLQAASTAFDARRPDLARPLVDEALSRPAFRLYLLPVPADLQPDDVTVSLKVWRAVQAAWWQTTCARVYNAGRDVLRLAIADKSPTSPHFDRARRIADSLIDSEPATLISLYAGLSLRASIEDAQAGAGSPASGGLRTLLEQVRTTEQALSAKFGTLKTATEEQALALEAAAVADLRAQVAGGPPAGGG